jgi:Ca2+-binding EF-hand superfamily protein
MNHEVEALEAVRRERAVAEEAKRARDTGHKVAREHSLGEIERQLASLKEAIEQGRHKERWQHKLVHEKLIPKIERMVAVINQVPGQKPTRTSSLSKALQNADGEDIGQVAPTIFAREIREETLPQWLEWLEESLGRYRDLLRSHAGSGEAFPATAIEAVRDLSAKPKPSDKPPQMVRKEELPVAFVGLTNDAMLTAAQRREQFEEDVDEEDFDVRPFKLKEIRMKAEEAIKRRRARLEAPRSKHGVMPGEEEQRKTVTVTVKDAQATAAGSHTVGYEGLVAQGGHARIAQPESGQEADLDSSLPLAPIPDETSQEGSQRSVTGQDEMQSQSSQGDLGDARGKSPKEFQKSAKSKQVNEAMVRSGRRLSAEAEREQFHNKMSRDELKVNAERFGLTLDELCFLKAEFDAYDEDGSGYIEMTEVRGLMTRLGAKLDGHELEQAFRELDSDGSGAIEFFEFVEWFTAPDE